MKKTNLYSKLILVTSITSLLVFGAALINAKNTVFAEPKTTSITCKDGTKVTVDLQAADTSYKTACGSHGYDNAPSSDSSGGSNSTNPLDGVSLEPIAISNPSSTKTCGSGTQEVKVAFDFGCLGSGHGELNPIVDIAFAIFRFLSAGVGLIVIGSIVVAGIQYSASRGNPQATEASIKRISNALIGLLIYIFLVAIANFLVPGGMF